MTPDDKGNGEAADTVESWALSVHVLTFSGA
jgi:hypothetical protein